VTPRRLLVAVTAITGLALAWLLFIALPRWYARTTTTRAAVAAAPAASAPPPQGKKIKARLFFVSDDGMRLAGVEREVAYGEGPAEQAREIVQAQIAPVSEPLASAIPRGTTLRALYLTDRGEAYVDLSREFATAHPGGTVNELLTVYTIVNALTVNLPAVTAVQVLVDGKEVDTLAGHVDLRRPLAKSPDWVQ
jgi:hypothetical protein